jgi:hypothetical protein
LIQHPIFLFQRILRKKYLWGRILNSGWSRVSLTVQRCRQ